MNNNLLNIGVIRKYIFMKRVYWTKHCLNRLNQRNILMSDVKNAINNGEIIEYYYNDYPYPSCLIMGYTKSKKELHLVCGINKEYLFVITAYYPNSDKWEDDMKIRRKQ